MTREQKAAYVNAQAVAAMAEIHAMAATNHECLIDDASPKYKEEDFRKVAAQFGIDHNSVMSLYALPDY